MTSTLAEWHDKDHYLVWIEIEKYSAADDDYEQVDGLPFPSTARFETLEEAQQHANAMHNAGGGD